MLLVAFGALIATVSTAQAAVTFGTSLKGQGFYCGHEQTVFQRGCKWLTSLIIFFEALHYTFSIHFITTFCTVPPYRIVYHCH